MEKEKVGPTRAVRLPESLDKKILEESDFLDRSMAYVIRKRLELSYKVQKRIK